MDPILPQNTDIERCQATFSQRPRRTRVQLKTVWVLTLVTVGFVISTIASSQTVPVKDPPPGWPGQSLKGIPCTQNAHSQGFGPYDYNDPVARGGPLHVVDKYHFTRDVQQLTSGSTNVRPGPDIDYTLRAFPNHHKALYAVVRLFLRPNKDPSMPPPECYLQRAIKFRPNDGVVWTIYGVYLQRLGRYQDALSRYKKAIELMPKSAEAHYNLGLLYLDLKQYSDALEQAHTAYTLGFPLPGLRDRLKEAGHWQ